MLKNGLRIYLQDQQSQADPCLDIPPRRTIDHLPNKLFADGLKEFPEAITAVFPLPRFRPALFMIRNSLGDVSWKDRKGLAAELKTIHRAETAQAAFASLEDFSQGVFGAQSTHPTPRCGNGSGNK